MQFADRPSDRARVADRPDRVSDRPDRAGTGRAPAGPQREVDGQPGYRDRGSQPRPAVLPDGAGQSRRPVPAAARGSAKPGRGGQEAHKDWESMSDVDYWAELAADKPLTGDEPTTAIPAATTKPPQRRPAADSRPLAPAGQAELAEAGKLPVRSRPQPGSSTAPAARSNSGQHARPADSGPHSRPGASGPHARPDVSGPHARPDVSGPHTRPAVSGPHARPGDSGQNRRPADLPSRGRTGDYPAPQPGGAEPSLAALARLAETTRSTPAPGYDDDPLTSPSFPAIGTSDSRSYRTRRSDRQQTGSHAAPPAAAQQPAGYQPSPQHGDAGYGQAAAGSGWQPGYDGAGAQPSGYQSQHASLPPAAPPPAAASYRNHPSLPLPTGPQPVPSAVSQPLGQQPSQQASQPAGNPYGSYVTDSPASYQQQPAPAAAPAYQGSYQYEQPLPQHGYLPAAGQYGNGPYYHDDANGYTGNGYSTADYARNGYQLGSEHASYPPPAYQPAPPSQGGYGQPEPTYGLDSTAGYPGYGAAGR